MPLSSPINILYLSTQHFALACVSLSLFIINYLEVKVVCCVFFNGLLHVYETIDLNVEI